MLRLLSLFAIVAGPAALLGYIGTSAFGNGSVRPDDGPIYAVFEAFPADAGYIAPLVAIALIAGLYMALRLLGFAISVIGGLLIMAMIATVFFFPDWLTSSTATPPL